MEVVMAKGASKLVALSDVLGALNGLLDSAGRRQVDQRQQIQVCIDCVSKVKAAKSAAKPKSDK